VAHEEEGRLTMDGRFASLLLKETIQFFRDRFLLGLILFLYTIDTIMCTLALSYDVKHVPLAIVDSDQTVESRDLSSRFFATDSFRPAGHPTSEAEAGAWLQSGRTMAAIVIPKGFAGDLRARPPAKVQILLDGTDSNTALITRGYVLRIIEMFEQAWTPKGTRISHAMAMPVTRVWFNPSMTFTAFMILSMISQVGLMVGIFQSAASIVREKEAGTIEQLMLTPIRTTELFAAKTLPTVAMGLLSIFPTLLIAWWFGVPLRGSLALVMALTALYLVSSIAIGVLIGSVSRTLQQALLLAFFVLFPILFLSGTLVPIESMPKALQWLSLISPVRHYLDIVLGVFLKGTGMAELWPQSLALAGIGAALFLIALWRFSRT
jgi:ABC-2 type transport system permease protein